jgi:hypothetical protein
MNYVIVEDESPAAKRLQRMVAEIAPDCNLLTVLESVETATTWFKFLYHGHSASRWTQFRNFQQD